MPGIAGLISQKPPEECQELVKVMLGCLKHERFYASGLHAEPALGVYAGCVGLEGSFAAGEVLLNEERNVALLLSGEVVVDADTEAALRNKGHRLESLKAHALVHLYEEEGEQFFQQLNGVFSGLLVDARRRKAFLFNDRYGFERIYWHQTTAGFFFASEAKALLRVLPELRRFDEAGVRQFLTFGCTLGWKTLFRGIGLLPGASIWSFENGTCQKRTYFSSSQWESQPLLSPNDFQSEFRETFKRILPRYLQGGSNVGISLTAGLDTRMIMACLPEAGDKQLCCTFAGRAGDTLDVRLAAKVAALCGREHRTLRLRQDFFSDFAAHADRTVYLTDGYFGITGAHEIYLNSQARQLAPVRLTGVFGSEVLRGTSTFRPSGISARLPSPDLQWSASACVRELNGPQMDPVSFAAFKEIPWSIFGSVAACRSQVAFRTPYLDNEIVSLAYRTPRELRGSSAVAFDVIRQNHQSLSEVPTDMGHTGVNPGWKGPVRRGFSKFTFKLDYLANDGLPHWLTRLDPLLDRLNSGTGILGLHKFLRYRRWFRRELTAYVTEAVAAACRRQSGFWDARFVENMAREHISGRKNYVQEINAVLTLDAVERLLLQ